MSAIIYLVRHGEVEHHRADVGITERGHEQARAAAEIISRRIEPGDSIYIYHAPVKRVSETAADIHQRLSAQFIIPPIQPDASLCNVRFMAQVNGQEQIEEPSLLYEALIGDAVYMQSLAPARAEFYRGFYDSSDPMGYWMERAQLSDGGVELPETVLQRLLARIKEIHSANANDSKRSHWILTTHSGALRVFLRNAFGEELGEPEFCAVITLLPSELPNQVTLSYKNTTCNVILNEVKNL